MEKFKGDFDSDLFISSSFWNSRLENLTHPAAIRMAADLEVSGPLGIGDSALPFWKGFKHGLAGKDSNIDFLLRVKKKHPLKIILVQIGEFYETWGLDSVFLVEHCGINRMGRRGPRAGMPLANIQAVLDDLTDAGFCAVVCEQLDDVSKGGRKVRFISEVITPSSPTYTYGLAMSNKANIAFPDAPLEFGLAFNSKGIKLLEVNPDLRTSLVLEGLTREAAIIRLSKFGGRINRLFVHEKVPGDFLNDVSFKSLNLVKISGYSTADFVKRVEELIKIDLDLDSCVSFVKTKPLSLKDSPNPLYLATAKQIGILPKSGIPSLINLMLPKGSPPTCKHIIRNLLLHPPSTKVANSLRKAIDELARSDKELPSLIVSNPVKYVKTLNKKEAHPEILKDLFLLANIYLEVEKKLSKKFVRNSLDVVSNIASIRANNEVLNETSNRIIDILAPILPFDEDMCFEPKNEAISKYLFEHIEEDFRGRVSRTANEKIAKLYDKIDQLAKKYEKTLEKRFLPVINELKTSKARKPSFSYDIHDQSIWLSGNISPEMVVKYGLSHPLDRYNKQVKDRWSHSEVDEVLNSYKESTHKVYAEIKKLLEKISKDLSIYCLPIIHLATFSNLVKTICLHIKESVPKDWTSNFEINKNLSSQIEVGEFFPYWMDSSSAILNRLNFDGTCLLTGHNMSGKSTLIRSLASITLLGSCGFMFPAKKVSLAKEIDGWFVRTGAQDDPEAGLSAFAVEMNDVKVALRDSSEKSFLLIDELGKGTESKAGHAIAASVLEHLAKRNIRAIFATHWHEIFVNEAIELENIKLIKMKCIGDIPTYRVSEGMDLNSSAFYTALKSGLDQEIVERAEEIAQTYDRLQIINQEDNVVKLPTKIADNINFIKEIIAKICQINLSQIKTLNKLQSPPLNIIGSSIIYVLKTKNNFFYVGETDNFDQRIKAHQSRLKCNECEFFYITIKEGKSKARKIEQELIIRLKNSGLPMLSISDGGNLNFGIK